MLANLPDPSLPIGTLAKDLHIPSTFLHELLAFIGGELPKWRDRADRENESSETVLSDQLCAHLNGVTRRAQGWDILHFRSEVPDELEKGRKVDLVAAPRGVNIWVDGRCYTDFDPLLPIECKRLPTPSGAKRDEREYIFSKFSSTGGVQRFKAGHHGGYHKLGAMIGYIQSETSAAWTTRVAEWIDGLINSGEPDWSASDHFVLQMDDVARGLCTLHSTHKRQRSLPEISLKHLWIVMN